MLTSLNGLMPAAFAKAAWVLEEVLAVGAPGTWLSTVPLLQDRGLLDGQAAAYTCRDFACQAPVALVGALELLHDAPCGKVHTFLEYRRSLEQAGFVGVSEVDESLIKAVKP